MKILITGGAGYLGSVLADLLLNTGHTVTVLDDLSAGVAPYHLAHRQWFGFMRGDAGSEEILERVLRGHDAIVPLAGVVGQSACDVDPERASYVNLQAIRTLLRLRSPEQKIVYPATNSGYGTKSGQVECDEQTPLEPITHYGRTKVEAEKAVLDAPNTVSLRFATLFGTSHRMRWDLLVNFFVRRASKNSSIRIFEPEFRRNFCHVRDAAEAICFALKADTAQGVYNVGLSHCPSKAELAGMVKASFPNFHVELDASRQDPDRRNYVVSVAKLERAGWVATRGIGDGIKELARAALMIRDEA